MSSLKRSTVVALSLLGVIAVGWVTRVSGATPEEIEQRLKALEAEIGALKQQLNETKASSPATAPAIQPPSAGTQTPVTVQPAPAAAETPALARPSWLSDFRIGGYGSTRFEASDLPSVGDTFTFRRFVLSGDATIAERLRSVVEIELERFTELEVERNTVPEGGFQGFSQSIEGSNKTEISLEQAWVQLYLTDWAKFRMGNILVPVGRFNISHDDNRWDLPRRSLVDRGVSVLPSTAAWSEVGLGFNGDINTDRAGKFSYELYVVNGVALDSSLETVARGSGESETEVEIQPRRGTANLDVKRSKAGALRVAWSPSIGQELGVSGYFGRYTPDFLPAENLWAISADGKLTFGPFEVEAEYVRTHFGGIARVARGFAQAVAEKEFSAGTAPLDSTVEFELAGLADTKQGYWLDLRYRFFPDVLRDTILARKFENPQFILTTRWEQVWLDGLVRAIDFTGGALTSISRDNRFVNRLTLGFAYRPVPLVVFQAAYERTWTDTRKSLSPVTNFIPAGTSENTQNAFLFGVAFGF